MQFKVHLFVCCFFFLGGGWGGGVIHSECQSYIVSATPPKPLDDFWSNFTQIENKMCRCAWSKIILIWHFKDEIIEFSKNGQGYHLFVCSQLHFSNLLFFRYVALSHVQFVLIMYRPKLKKMKIYTKCISM